MKIWLHRRGRKTWMFEPSIKYNGLVYITHKNVYKLFWGPIHLNPCSVCKLYAGLWLTVENELRADYIEFENGAKYIFPEVCK